MQRQQYTWIMWRAHSTQQTLRVRAPDLKDDGWSNRNSQFDNSAEFVEIIDDRNFLARVYRQQHTCACVILSVDLTFARALAGCPS